MNKQLDHCDVAVIGAGPAGSMSAKYAAKAGAQVILLEEHANIGWPVECAGLLGQKAVEESELRDIKSIQGIFGATVYSPAGAVLTFKAKSTRAWVVDRRLFDREMARLALQEGSELRLCSNVRRLGREKDYRILTLAGGEEIHAKIVISAEGVRARLARLAGIRPPEMILSGAQVEVPFALDDPEKVEVHLGQCDGLFAWVIPMGSRAARIGLCARERSMDLLKSFLKKDIIKERLRGSAVSINVGGLPLGPPSVSVAEGFMAVGDAAGQVKPTSGGGIYPGLVAAKIAGRVAAAAALENDASLERMMEYDLLWRKALARELDIGMKANRMLNKLSPADLDEIVSYIASKPRLRRIIEEHGDIDRPSLLMAKMFLSLDWDAINLAGFLRRALF